jgi:hypothetical protein
MNRLDRLPPFWPGRTGSAQTGAVTSSDAAGSIEQTFHRMVDRAELVIIQHPKVAMTVAISLGIALGWMVKRR